jgi:hypothetical protein
LIGGPLNVKLMEQQFDEVMRLTASIKRGTVTASLILRKLAAYPRQNSLATGLREYGRLERTLFTLWNTVYLERAINALRERGAVNDALLGHIAPLGWNHIGLTGDYNWHANKRVAKRGFRLLRRVRSMESTVAAP